MAPSDRLVLASTPRGRPWPLGSPGRHRLLLLAGALVAASAGAQVATKTGNGDWNDPLLWSPKGVPSPNTGVVIAAPTAVTKTAPTRFVVLDSILEVRGDEGRLDVTNDIRIGTDYDKQGTLDVDSKADSAVQARGLSIGAVNQGKVLVHNGAVWLSQGLTVGSSSGSNPPDLSDHAAYGLLEINGSAATVTAASMTVGSFPTSATRLGSGEVTVSNGGKLSTGSGAIVNGKLVVRGQGSGWLLFNNTSEVNPFANLLSVGGDMSVLAGGVVSFDHASGQVTVYGDSSRGTRGTLTVHGQGSSLIVPRELQLGRANGIGGKMTISGGALVHSGSGKVSGRGEAQITGAGSVWQVDGRLDVENYDHASFMAIADGAAVTASELRIGNNNGPVDRRALVTLTGAGSSLIVATLTVGREAKSGQLEVLAGAGLASATAVVGENFRSRGDVKVDGAGSNWRLGASLTIGAMGVGTVQLANEGMLSAKRMHLGRTVDASIRNEVGGSLYLGGTTAAEAPGVLDIDEGISIQDTGRVIFNHNNGGYHFDTVVRSGAVREGLIDHRAGITHLDADLSSFSGDTHVNGGTLLVNGTLGSQRVTVASGAVIGGSGTILGDVFAQPGAVVNPGNSPGVLSIDGDLVLQDGAVLVMEITGSTAGAQHDRLNVGGDITFSMGTLELVFLGGYAPAAGQQFELFDVRGRFAGTPHIEVIGLLPGWLFDTHFDDGTGRFSLMSLSDGFSAAPVPMPASSALFAAGLAVLGWRLRSRRGGVAAPLAAALAR